MQELEDVNMIAQELLEGC